MTDTPDGTDREVDRFDAESDTELRRRGRDAFLAAAASVDVDAEWESFSIHRRDMAMGTTVPVPNRPRRRGRRTMMLVAAAALLAVGTTTLLVRARQQAGVAPSTLGPDSTVPVPSRGVTTAPQTITSTTKTSSTDVPTTPPPGSVSRSIAMSSSDLPPIVPTAPYAIVPLATVGFDPASSAASGTSAGLPQIVYNRGFVNLIGGRSVVEIDAAGRLNDYPIVDQLEGGASLTPMAIGPNMELYVLYMTNTNPTAQILAIDTFNGAPGRVLKTVDLGPKVDWLNLPRSAFGNGARGVVSRIARGDVPIGGQVIDYVDALEHDGDPLARLDPATFVVTSDSGNDTGTGATWQLEIDHRRVAPTAQDVPAPGANDTTVFATHLPADSEAGPAPVIAVLRPDGGGDWYRLPEGFVYLSSDVVGTMIGRLNDDGTLELRTIDQAAMDAARSPQPVDAIANEESDLAQCDADGICDQIVFAADGTPVVYSPSRNTLTAFTATGDVTVDVPPDIEDPWLLAVGPGQLAYLAVPGTGDFKDLIAVDLSGAQSSDQFAIVDRLAGVIDPSGDTDYVPTASGLFAVGCCDQAMAQPPESGTPMVLIVPWASPPSSQSAGWNRWAESITVEQDAVDETLVVHRVTDTVDRSWTVAGLHGWMPRGMPMITATYDGGFVAALPDETFESTYVVRGYIEGTTELVSLAAQVIAVDPAGRVYTTDVGSAGGDGQGGLVRVVNVSTRLGFTLPSERAPDGALLFPKEPRRIRDGGWSSLGPVELSYMVRLPPDLNDRVYVDVEPGEAVTGADGATVDTTNVTFTISNLADDSNAAVRDVITVSSTQPHYVISGIETWQCQPGRGHQDFTPEPCN